MTESREASWYEIALTHSQIVKIFVALLLCLVAAFFSGVWIGRDADASQPAPALPQVASNELSDAVENGEVDRLGFFKDPEEKEPEPAIEAVGADTTLVDDLEGRDEEVAKAEPAPQRRPPETLIARADAAAERRKGPDSTVEVTREAPKPAQKQQEPVVAQTPAQGNGDLVVQVFSSNDANQARRVLGRLASGGHPAFLSPVEVEGRTMYRVRIGPYAERGDAERVADTVKRTYKLDTWITSKST